MRHEGDLVQKMKVLPRQLSVQSGSYPDDFAWDGPRGSELWGQVSALGGLANRRAETQVNPEQASKVKSWSPIRFRVGEGRSVRVKQLTNAALTATGVVGSARREGLGRNVGDPGLSAGPRPATSPGATAGPEVGEAHSTGEAG